MNHIKIIGLAVVIWLSGAMVLVPMTVSAATLTQAQIDAIVSLLQSFGADQNIVSSVQATLSGGTSLTPPAFCHNFDVNLGVGNSGDDVCALRTALQKEGFETENTACEFDEELASAISGFQQKYIDEILRPLGLRYGTGYVGKATRAKLNKLYGCGIAPLPTTPVQACNTFLTCETGYRPYNIKEKDSQGCPIIKCILPATPVIPSVSPVSEQVKCLFHNSTTVQECYSSAGVGCKDMSACVVDVKGTKGEQITWKSTCGGYAYTTMDGQNEYAEFKCAATIIPISPPCTTEAKICPNGTAVSRIGPNCEFAPCPTTGNQPPVIYGVGGPTTLKINETGTWTVKASDPEQGTLNYSVVWGDEPLWVSPTLVPKSTTYNQTATFIHSYASAGVYYPTVIVTDNQGLSAKTSIGVNVGEVPPPSITLISPNGGEVFKLGSTYNVMWKSSNVTRVVLDLVDSTGKIFIYKNLVNVSGNPGSASWTIPTYTESGQYRMRIGTCSISVTNCITTGVEDPVTIYDISDAAFSIVSIIY